VEVALFDMVVLLQIFLDIITPVLYSYTDALSTEDCLYVMCLVMGRQQLGGECCWPNRFCF